MSHYLTFPTLFGECGLIFRPTPFRLLKVLLPRTSRSALEAALAECDEPTAGTHDMASQISASINDYFERKAPRIAWPPWEWMCLKHVSALQRAVLAATAQIPHGQTNTYKGIARAVGRPKAYRFIGNTMAQNPFPLLIPCHRVIKSDGSLGGFGGGVALKQKLIALEARGLC